MTKFMRRFISVNLIVILIAQVLLARPDQAEFDAVERIIVVGDVHGDFDKFKDVLQSAGIIDSKLKWTGEKTHLVQLGDIPDRGPDTREIYAFMKKLETGARRAGGRVHTLIGNHDAMNIYGDLRYVTEDEYKAFASRKSKSLLNKLYEEEVDWIKKNRPEEEWPEFDKTYKEAWLSRKPEGYVEHRLSWLPDGELGKRVIIKNAVLKIGDTLFVHGGIGPGFVNMTIKDINNTVRETLVNLDNQPDTILRREDGPLWYRGLALQKEHLEEEHVKKVLENFEVKRIVVGHTPTPGVIVPRFDGRVILADVGLSRYYGEHLACLEIVKDKTYAIHRGERLPLPEGNNKSFIEYLEAINNLEPNNKEAQKWISRLKNTLSPKKSKQATETVKLEK